MKHTGSAESFDAALSKACGMEVTASSVPTHPVANVQTSSITFSSSDTTSFAATVAQTTSIKSAAGPAGFVSSSSTIRSVSSSVKPITTSAPPPKATSAPPPRPVTTSRARPPVTRTTSPLQPSPAPTKVPQQASAASTGGSSSGSTSNSDIQAYLSSHNTVRAQHGAKALTWSDDLASKAQEWADGCLFQHSGGKFGRLGENLAAGTGSYSIQTAVKSWTDEVSEYDPSNPKFSHFTQVVWKATTQVGCAVQSCDGIFDAAYGKAKYYVCEYSPAGNIAGQFAENVQV
ncbi:CAP domain-containing protein [Lyophyllum atratum]|nr:CAP domain-containing protein [Lyophyllum atratum]